jgi:hypothetical protein
MDYRDIAGFSQPAGNRHGIGLPWVLAAAFMAACSAPPVVRAPAQPAQTSPQGSAAVDASLKPLVDVAIADLARRLNVDRTSITVVEARAMVWPDGAMGCPRPGMVYPQVQQDGTLIRLTARGQDYAYHSGGSRPPFLCQQ